MNDRTDVLVVGAGPVGLVLATELRLAGVEPTVIERDTEPLAERRARGLGPLAAEALRRRGLGPRIASFHQAAQAQLENDHGSPNQHFAHIHKIAQEDPDRAVSLIWQPDLVRVLGSYADELGVTVHRGHELVALEPDGARVAATIRTPQGHRTVRARYLVGCDGGRSAVRGLAGFDFPGTEPTMITRGALAEIVDSSGLPPSGRLPTGAVLYGPGMVGTFEFAETGHADLSDAAVTAAAIEASIHRLTGVRIELTEVSGFIRATDNARQASTYRIGRVLLAGDAAHVHSPNGGQGLTLGVVDAANLGWKLAATVLRTAPEGQLDTYTAERHPAAAAVLHNTIAQTALLRPGPHVDALRDIMSDLMDIPEVNRYFGRMVNGLNTRYDLGYQPTDDHPLLGALCPDLRLRTEHGPATLAEFTTDGGAVLVWPDLPMPVVPARVTVVPVTWIERDLGAALVRPDGMLAWCATAGAEPDHATLTTALAAWFGA